MSGKIYTCLLRSPKSFDADVQTAPLEVGINCLLDRDLPLAFPVHLYYTSGLTWFVQDFLYAT